ncbi:leucine efflux protein LeuE [uncultured Thiothrix sp.]|uniref:leucine efflux protein LeuE n=1 Tax=uncultured Thiothrix sp. TaxID=223185 RepID=UPI002620BD46|nr:leucine efflux protein LeuE [uncultured Thiothrix sp.]HMT94473.1 leucine efflux protein LeuE [Thiolinea sp.]
MEQFGVHSYLTYVLGVIMIVLLPGPNSVFVLALSAQKGVRAGWKAAMGIFVGDAILMLASAAGAVTLLKTYPLLFHIVQYVGAAYLIYLGLRLIIAAVKTWPKEQALQAELEKPLAEPKLAKQSSPFIKALIISLLNPKAILFFLSFFVQFVDPQYPQPALSFLILAVTLQFFSALYLAALIYGGHYLAEAFRQRKRLSAVSTGGTGVAFLGFAAKLATASALA